MSKTIKAAVIGLGVGMAHAKGYMANPEAELIAICDIDPVRLKERGDLLGIPTARRFIDYNDVFKLPELDVVSIALPNYLHAPVAIDAFHAGKHVLSEKPLARSAEEAGTMV
ncbi:MAG: Gfo/Idh/MocA family oxidoreductase, partial [Anaerolineaceae bacterium]|nr:Gfo/Idh/MocA family oxidoreductase [Anaerolineaceae bacterium]